MSAYTYTPKGVCSMKIDFDVEDGILKNEEVGAKGGEK